MGTALQINSKQNSMDPFFQKIKQYYSCKLISTSKKIVLGIMLTKNLTFLLLSGFPE